MNDSLFFIFLITFTDGAAFIFAAFSKEKRQSRAVIFIVLDCFIDVGRLYWLSMVVIWTGQVCSLPGVRDFYSRGVFHPRH